MMLAKKISLTRLLLPIKSHLPEDEWKVRQQYGVDKRRVQLKLHLAVDSAYPSSLKMLDFLSNEDYYSNYES